MIARAVHRLPCTLGRALHLSAYRQRVVTEIVPALGESITEGSVAHWAKREGDRLSVDDVVLVVETDKVTVDIKAIHAGVLVRRLVSDTVHVGKPLYEVDVDESQAIAAQHTDSTANTAAHVINVNGNGNAQEKQHAVRQPRIKFLGKRKPVSVDLKASPSVPVPVVNIISPSHKAKAHHASSVDFSQVKDKAWFGRPKLEAKEMHAIESGGAF